eukprot:1321295-Amorphochlora_amoeboformis.AAC.1
MELASSSTERGNRIKESSSCGLITIVGNCWTTQRPSWTTGAQQDLFDEGGREREVAHERARRVVSDREWRKIVQRGGEERGKVAR